eukprot:COSAG02_NODE_63381_length_263_cov_0.646341_1_plen_47_part_10
MALTLKEEEDWHEDVHHDAERFGTCRVCDDDLLVYNNKHASFDDHGV